MELILVAVALVLVAALFVREAEPRPAGELEARPEGKPEPRVEGERAPADHAPVRDIVPDIVPDRGPGSLDDEDIQEIVIDTVVVPSIGVPVLRPDPARFFQHELLEPVGRARTTAAVVRLLVVVVTCGIAGGVMVVLIGRGIGVIIRRVSGA